MRHLQKKLHYLSPKAILFDEGNPRGESKAKIISDPEFKKLVKSIKDFGVLEPLIARKTAKGSKHVLVDGERRLRASIEAREPEVPVLLANSEADGRILAYQVHKLRKDWTPVAETKSIKKIILNIKEDNPSITEVKLKKKIRDATNIKKHSLDDIMRLIKYDDDIIDKVIADKKFGHSYLVQIESGFVNKVKRFYPEVLNKYDENKIRHILAKKALQGYLKNTRYLMDTFKSVFASKDNKAEIQKILLNFLKYKNKKIETVFAEFQELSETRKTKKKKKAKKKKAKKKKAKRKTNVPAVLDHTDKLSDIERKVISSNVFDLLFNYMRESVVEFQKQTGTTFSDEPELQKFIYSMLRTLFVSVEYEDPTEKLCGKFNRLDFVLKDHKIIIEVKYIRDKKHGKSFSEELSVDYLRYQQSPYGKTIINYIYDPNKHIVNHALSLRQLNRILVDAHNYIQ